MTSQFTSDTARFMLKYVKWLTTSCRIMVRKSCILLSAKSTIPQIQSMQCNFCANLHVIPRDKKEITKLQWAFFIRTQYRAAEKYRQWSKSVDDRYRHVV